MNRNLKLYFQYMLFNTPHLYLENSHKSIKNVSVVLPKNAFYFIALHLRFSSIFYSTQLVDICAYELPLLVNKTHLLKDTNTQLTTSNSIIVYNFHHLTSQERFFFFCIDFTNKNYTFSLNSISELFSNS